jgi:hypothetical protein
MELKMKSLLSIFALALLLITQSAYSKEIAVLLPVIGPLTASEKMELSKTLVDGLSDKFVLRHGEEVDRYVKQAFQEESKKNDCDENHCYRRIADHYHAEKIIALRITEVDKDNYLIVSNLYDVATGEIASAQKEECGKCSIDKLKSLCKEIARRMSEQREMNVHKI